MMIIHPTRAFQSGFVRSILNSTLKFFIFAVFYDILSITPLRGVGSLRFPLYAPLKLEQPEVDFEGDLVFSFRWLFFRHENILLDQKP